MKEKTIRATLKSFDGLVQILTSLRNSIIKLEGQCAQIRARLTELEEHKKLLDGRWFETIKALALLDERLTDLEDRVTENGG